MKPIIGISCGLAFNTKSVDFSQLPQQFHQLSDTYVTAVECAGGIPVILPSYEDSELAIEAAERLDAVIFSGGGDVNPLLFHSRALSNVTPIQPRRDKCELALARHLICCTDMPVLGICRGMQAINVALGGDVCMDLKSEGKLEHRMSMYPRHMPSHSVKIDNGSRLSLIMGGTEQQVNSYHHQAVKTVAEGMVATAYSVPDDVIEAMEIPGERFVLAVQWHPEGMSGNEEQQAIFCTLVSEAQKYRARK